MKRISSGRKFKPPKICKDNKENITVNKNENSPGEVYEHRIRNVDSIMKKVNKSPKSASRISNSGSPAKRGESNSIDRLVR